MADQNAMREMTKKVWAAGDYAAMAKPIFPISAKVVRVAQVRPGERVLDVACGAGPVAITARRAGAQVTGLDITPELLARAKQEAAISGVDDITWKEGDAESLPFEDASFDVVLSSVGHMFAPRPEVVAREMLRVTKPGGRIAFATWPPDGAVGAIFQAGAKYGPPPPGANPLDWGVPSIVKERFAQAREIVFQRDVAFDPALSPEEYWHKMSEKFGPVVMTIAGLRDRAKVAAFRADFIQATQPWFQDNQLRLDYLVTRIVKA